MKPIPIISYHGTRNLGDAIQTVALMAAVRKLDKKAKFDFVRRDHLSAYHGPTLLVNGYHRSGEERGHHPAHFIGIHADPNMEQWLWRCRGFIGARDPWAHEWMKSKGLPSQLVGCATMVAFDRYTGTRHGDYEIDIAPDQPIMSQDIPEDWNWDMQVVMAKLRLQMIKTAASVVTSRLHIALPCLAFGTPVQLLMTGGELERYTIAQELGLTDSSFVSNVDLEPWKERFNKLLIKHLQEIHQ